MKSEFLQKMQLVFMVQIVPERLLPLQFLIVNMTLMVIEMKLQNKLLLCILAVFLSIFGAIMYNRPNILDKNTDGIISFLVMILLNIGFISYVYLGHDELKK